MSGISVGDSIRDIMRRGFILTICLCLPSVVGAHGGVSIEDDVCILKVADMKAHFTGYQPEVRSSQEFCEDIPETNRAIIVLDFISNELRGMPGEFRILRETSGKNENTSLADLGTEADIKNATLLYKPPALYPRGTVTVDFTFTEPGWYVGLFTIEDPLTGDRQHSVFPFSVGVKAWWRYPLAFMLVLALSALVYWFTSRKFST